MLDALRALFYAALKGLAVSFEKLLSKSVHLRFVHWTT